MRLSQKKMALILLILIGLQGCIWVEDPQDLSQFVEQNRKKSEGKVKALPELIKYERFVYQGASKRDPFLAAIPIGSNQQEAVQPLPPDGPDLTREKELLEQFAIDHLVLVGMMTSPTNGEPIALVRDPDTEIHSVRLNNRMGLDHGIVVSLTDQEVVLEELVTNGRGGWMKRPRTLSLNVQN